MKFENQNTSRYFRKYLSNLFNLRDLLHEWKIHRVETEIKRELRFQHYLFDFNEIFFISLFRCILQNRWSIAYTYNLVANQHLSAELGCILCNWFMVMSSLKLFWIIILFLFFLPGENYKFSVSAKTVFEF